MTQYLQKVQRGVLVLPLQRKVPSNRWLEETLSVCDVVLVDDGLPGDLGIQLDTLVRPGVHLERHALPLGHGRAVKTGLQHIIGSYPKDTPAVIALADVFSPVEDIALLLMALEEQGNCMAVGIPPEKAGQSLKDRGLKWIATSLFAIVQGKRPTIIRVPLRALPGRMLPAAAVLQGEGDDYILNLLLVLCRKDIPVREIAVLDAVELPPIPWDIWAKLLLTVAAFLFSSLFSAMIDYLVFGIVYTTVLPATHIVPRNMELLTAQIAGRVVSCTINFLLNKKLVFRPESNSRGAAAKMLVKYYFLVIFSLAGSSLLLYPFSHFMGVPAMLAKPVVELVMYFINFFIQRDIIFKTKTKKNPGSKPGGKVLSMRDMGVVELALAYAARACSGLTLRGTKLPFIVHPAESLSIAASLTQDSEVLAAAVLKSMPGHTAPEDLKEIFSPRIAALVKEATADKGEDATAENWVERKTLALQLLQRGSRECMILVLANRLSDLRTMAALHAREGAGMWSILNRKDPRAQEWYYSTLLQVLRPLADTEAYRELQCRYTAVFGGD